MKLTAETLIASDLATVWRLSQTPDLHVRWDLRFSDIEYLPRVSAEQSRRFRYATRTGLGFSIQGWGATVRNPGRTTSALQFGSTDSKSLIREGAGSWTYGGHDGAVVFSTVYDYETRYGVVGRALDLVFRPLMIWATRWSFDRLRIWIEGGLRPEYALRLWIVKVVARCALALTWIYEGLVPKILAQRADEIALVSASGFDWGSPVQTLAALGAAEIAFGIWLLSGRSERTAAILSTIGICSLAALVVSIQPSVLADPFGGISKNLGLLACSFVVGMLSQHAPMARRAEPKRRRNVRNERRSPFAQALSDRIDHVAPLVRAHLTLPVGIHRYEGLMTSVWRVSGPRRWLTAPFLWVGSWMHTLFPETGKDVPFVIVNRVFAGADGTTRMTFERTFRFPGVERLFHATMRYDTTSHTILDALGRRGHLLVELVPTIEDGGITLRSRRQWLTPFGLPLRIPVPGILAGEATIQEWQDSGPSLGIRVTISNPIFGPFFGYEGTFRPIEAPLKSVRSAPGATSRTRLSHRMRAALTLLVVTGTVAYAASFAAAMGAHVVDDFGVNVAAAAALSWPVFGFALIAAHGLRDPWMWPDVCLQTMARGIAVLSVATALNLVLGVQGISLRSAGFVAAHVAVLVASNLVMATFFVREVSLLGMPFRVAAALWICVLNGVFGFLVAVS